MPNFSWCIHHYAELVGSVVFFFFFLVSFHGNSVKKVLRFLSCLFTLCSPAKRNLKHEKVFVAVFFPSGKQVY